MLYCLNYNNSNICQSERCTRLPGLIHGHFVMEGLSTSTLDLQATSPNTDACSVEQVRVRDSQERL